MIHANELQIGDWILSIIDRYDHTEKKPVRITGIRKDFIRTDDSDVWYPLETFEPIPLTPEILEKNFEKKTFYGIYGDYFDLEFKEYSDSIYIVTYHNCEFNLPDQMMQVSFVHELQHFLNHCGIEKEIKL